jgi:hypothetical protein
MRLVERNPATSTALLLPVWIVFFLVLQRLADGLVLITGLVPGERLTEAIRFFAFEVPKFSCF